MLRTAVHRLGGVSLELLGWSKAGSEVRPVPLREISCSVMMTREKFASAPAPRLLMGDPSSIPITVLTRAPRRSHVPVGGFNGGEGRWRF